MRVAVIIPNLNYGRFLGRALESVRKQTVQPAEVVVVDGRSSDSSFDVAMAYGARWIEAEPRGMANARNVGIAETDCEYILPLDADDWIDPTFIEKCLAEFNASSRLKAFPSLGVVGTQLCWPNGTIQGPKPPFTMERFLEGNLLFTCSIFRRKCWKEVGGYCEDRELYEDWHFWASIVAKEWKIWTVPEPLFHYCPHPDNSSSKMAHRDGFYRANTIKAIQRSMSVEQRLEMIDAAKRWAGTQSRVRQEWRVH